MRETVYDDGSASEVLERDETDLSGALVRGQESESGGDRVTVQVQREGDVEMTDVFIRSMVKCPMLFEHEPCDLVETNDCQTCKYLRWRYGNKIDCKWGEEE